MKFSKIVRMSIFQCISFIFAVGYFIGVLNIYFSDKNDYCVMTYMYEYPQYVRISLPENKNYPQYGLHAYSEGRFTERARKMWFDGVPVLFLPGNSGSHMQARSLASVALRKAISGQYEYHFDFFTISYNEELSGLYGGVLQHQTQFAAACIRKILSLYRSNKYTKSVPDSVILIGHSMGGVVAKRLLADPSTLNSTNIAITLAAPLEAPVVNFDAAMNEFYENIDIEWDAIVNGNEEMKQKKVLISIGSGPRDVLIPSGLTSSNHSFINALTTSIPGVWVSPDHVGIVWCKQVVMAINKFLFDIIDPTTEQVTENGDLLRYKATQYFQANRSMTLNPSINPATVTMLADAFWYEDSRRIYQISRPEVDKTTYLMIRLVSFPQNRFLAVEAVNVDDKDWIFGCSAKYTYNTHRYCKQATSLGGLSRWSGAAIDFGKRKLATVHLHNLIEQYPDWTHVIVKVSPTRKPIVLNVDVNDLASRQIKVDLPLAFSFGRKTIIYETEKNSVYYELVLQRFSTIYQAYLLYVEPTSSCTAKQYHVSAELHVPWAENHEYYHYFTHLKRSPMKLRLFKTNPNITYGLEEQEHVKITLLLDPQCTFTIKVSSSWYHQLAQFARNCTPMIFPYMCAILCLAARSNFINLQKHGQFLSIHGALTSESVKPYYVLVFARLCIAVLVSVPIVSYCLVDLCGVKNPESEYFIRSLLVLPTYMTALGLLNNGATIVVGVMMFSSQLAHRLLFRIIWRGGTGLAEKVASGLLNVPMVVSIAMVCAVRFSCGAAALVTGAAFYAFILSKMYEEYLEDYVYKMIAKVGSYLCRFMRSKMVSRSSEVNTSKSTSGIVTKDSTTKTESPSVTQKAIENNGAENNCELLLKAEVNDKVDNMEVVLKKEEENSQLEEHESNKEVEKKSNETNETETDSKNEKEGEIKSERKIERGVKTDKGSEGIDEDLNNLNFHMMMFFLWLAVTLVNIPALLTWARNFKYSMALKPDTSYYTGLILSLCSICIWQIKGPRKNLQYYELLSTLLFAMAVIILVLGTFSLAIINYGVTAMFFLITIQQLFDKEKQINVENTINKVELPNIMEQREETKSDEEVRERDESGKRSNVNNEDAKDEHVEQPDINNKNNECLCSENRIYRVFKNLREKFSFTQDL